jgi:hypothetical protein
MRRPAALFALLLVCVALAACGKSGYVVTSAHAPAQATTTTTTTAPTSTTPAPRAQPPAKGHGSSPTRAQAQAFASAVNLTVADVPGFTPTSNQHGSSPEERRLEAQLRSCTGASGASALSGSSGTLAEASSPDFQLRRGIVDLSVSSDVSVAQSAAQAAGVLSAIHSPRVHACLSRYLSALLRSEHYSGATVTGVSLSSGTPPAPGTAGGFGWRVKATLEVRGIPIPFYIDILGFVYGPAQVTLTSTGAVRAFPAAAQEQLFHTLLARAKAHSL